MQIGKKKISSCSHSIKKKTLCSFPRKYIDKMSRGKEKEYNYVAFHSGYGKLVTP